MLEELKTLNIDTVEFNPEFLSLVRPMYQEKFKRMSLEYDPSDRMDFKCEKMLLTSLEGVPQYVKGDFSCRDNQLTSLEGAPHTVGGDFDCTLNQLTSLEGAPQSVGGVFSCSNNQLTSLEGVPKSVVGYFYCDHNPRLSDEQINHYREFLKGQHQECMVDGHYMPPENLK